MLIFHPPEPGITHHKKMISDLNKFSKKYHRLLELEDWEIHIRMDTVPKDEDGKPEELGLESACANCAAQPEYLSATITFFLDALIFKERKNDLEAYVRHEFWHIILWPIAEMGNALASSLDPNEDASYAAVIGPSEESVTTRIERLKFWSRIK